ncbi:MAG: pantetheine-phosphate adenylyltransferase [Bauldia sp.]|nr:pantetheine-phosphate adenylyltransferase [Bauldia sp.]
MSRIAIFPGSFDPMTVGHVDVLAAALELADHVVLAIGIHPTRTALFTFEERAEMLREVVDDIGGGEGRVTVAHYDGLIVEAARAAGATILVRGIRDGGDLDGELRMAGMNAALAPEIRTVLVPARPVHRHISATLVRQISRMGGDVAAFVPPAVARRLGAGPANG